MVLARETRLAGQVPTPFRLTSTVVVGRQPHGIRFSDDGTKAYVALSGDGVIAVVDLSTLRVTERRPVPHAPLDLFAFGGDVPRWMVSQFGADRLAPLQDDAPSIRVGVSPSLFAPRSAAGLVAISAERSDTLSVLDVRTARIVAQYSTGRRPYPPDVTRDGVLALVPNRDDGTVTVIDLLIREVAATIPVCPRPEGGALTRDDVSFVVACGGDNSLAFVNTASFEVVARVSTGVGPRPFSVAMSGDGRWALVNNSGGRTVSVLDVAARRIVAQVAVDSQPIVIRMHPDGRRAFVSNEVSGTISVLTQTTVESTRRRASRKNEVLVLGTIHGEHRTSTRYSTEILRDVIRAIRPDFVLTEIPPNRFDAAMAEFQRTGTITEPRVARFPEYVDVLFPLTRELPFQIIPTAGWTRPMDRYRSAALARFAKDPAWASRWREYKAAEQRADSIVTARGADDPAFINSEEYDAVQAAAHEPYNRLLNDSLGPGGWDNINITHYGNIARALDAHRGEGKRFLIIYGAGHKEWFMRALRQRDDIRLLDIRRFLNP